MNLEDRLRDHFRTSESQQPDEAFVGRLTAGLPPRGRSRLSLRVAGAIAGAAGAALVVAVVVLSAPHPRQDGKPVGALPATMTPPTGIQVEQTQKASPSTRVTEASTASPGVGQCAAWPTLWPEPSFDNESPTQSEIDRQFWGDVTNFGRFSKTFDTLDTITRASHLVVEGHLVGFDRGYYQPFGADLPPELSMPIPELFGLVHVDKVLKGDPISRDLDVIEVAGLGSTDMAPTEVPDSEFIIFLVNHAQQRIDEGVPASCDPADRYHYERPNGYQTVLLEQQGAIQIIEGPKGWEDAFGPFPSQLDGLSVQAVEKEIVDASTATP